MINNISLYNILLPVPFSWVECHFFGIIYVQNIWVHLFWLLVVFSLIFFLEYPLLALGIFYLICTLSFHFYFSRCAYTKRISCDSNLSLGSFSSVCYLAVTNIPLSVEGNPSLSLSLTHTHTHTQTFSVLVYYHDCKFPLIVYLFIFFQTKRIM